MIPVWVAFCCGVLLGMLAGVFAITLCLAAKRTNDMMCRCDDSDQGRACKNCIGGQHA